MGCIFSWFRSRSNPQHFEQVQDEAPKVYSWDKKDRSKAQDFIIENHKGEILGRMPGTVDGQQLVIQNCQECNIYVFDYSATVSIDDCTNCNIILGPVKQSVFVRDSHECRLVVACQQFRARDCRHIDSFLLCETQPVIESSSKMRFASFKFNYPELESHLKASELSIFNNNWSNIHDFTPVPEEGLNYTYLPEDAKVEDFIPLPTAEPFSTILVSTDANHCIIPQTLGLRRKPSDEGCLIVFFNDGGSHDRAVNLIHLMKRQHPDCPLVQTKEIIMHPEDAFRIFSTQSYASAVKQGAVIGLEFCGPQVMRKCQACVVAIMTGTTGLVFVSQQASSARSQINSFFHFANMQMGL
ncbi:hypothetical protein C0Q70_21771 [Pomacea canaliculata]|uniref:Protein XRP2 n=2 Tax=Pomacea canaliculata TaxID=400727 RepID=A0A2T7NAQ1_POMCA|nr:hypothetical protein C0Q70_21771 [Pomacea canaliculata]